MKQLFLRLLVFIVIIAMVSVFSLRFFRTDSWKREVWISMNTFFEMQVPRAYFEDEIIEESKKILLQVEKIFSAYYEDSELSKINRNAHNETVELSHELYEVLLIAMDFYGLSEGLFDITFQPLQDAYGFHSGELTVPDQDELDEILMQIGARYILLDHEQRTIEFASPALILNLSGLIKGYALDQVGEYLEAHGVPYYILNFGGELRINAPRTVLVHIQDPRSKDTAGSIDLISGCISTSSDNNQFFIRDGKRYSHIINPLTGSAKNKLYSVTVVHPSSALIADILSTTMMLMEKEQAIAWISEHFPQVQWVIIDASGVHEWLSP